MWRTCPCAIELRHYVAQHRRCATEIRLSVAHGQVRHIILIFVARILWRTAHAPHNSFFGASLMSLFLLAIAPLSNKACISKLIWIFES
jgi:hypothetical protein